MAEIVYASVEDDAETVPPELRCIWPGCPRRRSPGRAAGSGRQKEYCLKADRPEAGGGPVHNARNRWAWLRNINPRDATGETATVAGDEAPPAVLDKWPVSSARNRASELLEQARKQHSAALASLRAERELYEQLGDQFRVMSDPAALDLEIASIGLKAGRDVSQAGEDAARARRAQLRAERERDEAIRLKEDADAAAEQFAADTEAAEQALAERAAEFERERDLLLRAAREAQNRADRAAADTEAATAEARAAVTEARRQVAAAETSAAAAGARAAVIEAEMERLRTGHAEELARLAAAHTAALDAERARARRAEDDLDALRADGGR
jgi:DNA repair exonuclease SbcCD ATPase subunit